MPGILNLAEQLPPRRSQLGISLKFVPTLDGISRDELEVCRLLAVHYSTGLTIPQLNYVTFSGAPPLASNSDRSKFTLVTANSSGCENGLRIYTGSCAVPSLTITRASTKSSGLFSPVRICVFEIVTVGLPATLPLTSIKISFPLAGICDSTS